MIVVKKNTLIIISVLLITVITSIICFSAINSDDVSASSDKIKIVLDAGHGGIDDGAIGTYTGAKESEINLSIVGYLSDYLEDAGFIVVLTRTSDAGLYGIATSSLKKKDMENRKKIILKANPSMVVSIHLNKYVSRSRRGAQVFYKKGDENGKKLAFSIQNEFNCMKEAVKSYSALTGDYYILNCTEIPSVICECGFLSNKEEEKLLLTEEYQKSIAYSVFKGIVCYCSELSIN